MNNNQHFDPCFNVRKVSYRNSKNTWQPWFSKKLFLLSKVKENTPLESRRPNLERGGETPPPVHTLVKLLHLSIPRWSRPLVEVHTLVKLLHQSIHWWSRPLVVHAGVALIPTETYVYLSLFRFLLVCLFVCLFSLGLDLTFLNCLAMCGEILSWSLWVCNNNHMTLWRWELHVNIRVFLLPLHLSGRDNRGRD